MRNLSLLLLFLTSLWVNAQIDKEQLALDISKADALNAKNLMPYTWKRTSVVSVEGEVKSTLINEVSFDSLGKVQIETLDVQSTTKDKIGIRGRIQDSKKKDMMEYVEKSLKLALNYTYMSKGEFLDFFERAVVTTKDGIIEAKGSDLYVKGDSLTVRIDEKSKLFVFKEFSSTIGEDLISGQIKYELFSSGISHGAETVLKLPGKNMTIQAKNHDYSIHVL